ncbi:protein of unknown function [Candidatus Filomicrobium marinum]|uniref:Uncharacterized protein n=1 Tax=Candidatus Filomicrobium marinum TaxID=1608628 RepID=A0A0D6JFX5_9HYPH|nr:hypothetical protein [Candidatus Filomicrobium marinum]CFX24602.1 protein of unknown function [Candidatus Filomicrobium marinum]CPR19191.1 protein of unknown function [Candidatus Filomicrobium marinum]
MRKFNLQYPVRLDDGSMIRAVTIGTSIAHLDRAAPEWRSWPHPLDAYAVVAAMTGLPLTIVEQFDAWDLHDLAWLVHEAIGKEIRHNRLARNGEKN